jgi:polo-like kinase 4
MVRGKTPKVTFYSDRAKCQLMETLEDFEMVLYKGGNVFKKGTASDFELSDSLVNFNERQNIIQHAERCYQHCIEIERTLSSINSEQSCFPAIIGRRPAELESSLQPLHDNTYNNYISSSQTPLRAPKIQMPSFSVDQTPSSVKGSFRYPDTPVTPNVNGNGIFQQKTMIPGKSIER